jgi:glycine cleavage system H protein
MGRGSSRAITSRAQGGVNADPQGRGWFFKLRLEDIKAMDGLMDEAGYKKLID